MGIFDLLSEIYFLFHIFNIQWYVGMCMQAL
jgi:hypothetical protein